MGQEGSRNYSLPPLSQSESLNSDDELDDPVLALSKKLQDQKRTTKKMKRAGQRKTRGVSVPPVSNSSQDVSDVLDILPSSPHDVVTDSTQSGDFVVLAPHASSRLPSSPSPSDAPVAPSRGMGLQWRESIRLSRSSSPISHSNLSDSEDSALVTKVNQLSLPSSGASVLPRDARLIGTTEGDEVRFLVCSTGGVSGVVIPLQILDSVHLPDLSLVRFRDEDDDEDAGYVIESLQSFREDGPLLLSFSHRTSPHLSQIHVLSLTTTSPFSFTSLFSLRTVAPHHCFPLDDSRFVFSDSSISIVNFVSQSTQTVGSSSVLPLCSLEEDPLNCGLVLSSRRRLRRKGQRQDDDDDEEEMMTVVQLLLEESEWTEVDRQWKFPVNSFVEEEEQGSKKVHLGLVSATSIQLPGANHHRIVCGIEVIEERSGDEEESVYHAAGITTIHARTGGPRAWSPLVIERSSSPCYSRFLVINTSISVIMVIAFSDGVLVFYDLRAGLELARLSCVELDDGEYLRESLRCCGLVELGMGRVGSLWGVERAMDGAVESVLVIHQLSASV